MNVSKKSVALAMAIALVATSATIAVSQVVSDSPSRDTDAAIDILPADAGPVVATWTRSTSHTNNRYFYYTIEFTQDGQPIGVSDLVFDPVNQARNDFGASGGLQGCVFSPVKSQINPEPSLDSLFAEYSTVYNVMVTCRSGTGTFVPEISGTVAVAGADVEVDNQPIEEDRGVVVTTYPVLTVTKSGRGSGYVSSTTSSFQCGVLCSADYPPNVYGSAWPVTLRARPYAGSIFTGWSGACTGVSTCRLTMSKSNDVTANFEPAGGVMLQKIGTGKGSVISKPAGISCPATTTSCAMTWHRDGTTLVVTATAARGFKFVGWAGACSGTAKTCTLRVTAGENLIPLYTIFE